MHDEVEITVERIDDGEVSPFLHDVVVVGDRVELRGPIGGYFVWEAPLGGPLLLVAGGSGVVPLMAMLRHRLRPDRRSRRACCSARATSRRSSIARSSTDLASNGDGFEVFHTLTRSQPSGWSGFARRIDERDAGGGARAIGHRCSRLPVRTDVARRDRGERARSPRRCRPIASGPNGSAPPARSRRRMSRWPRIDGDDDVLDGNASAGPLGAVFGGGHDGRPRKVRALRCGPCDRGAARLRASAREPCCAARSATGSSSGSSRPTRRPTSMPEVRRTCASNADDRLGARVLTLERLQGLRSLPWQRHPSPASWSSPT